MYGQQLNIDTIANNMSNVSTIGYKKQRIEFQDLIYQQIRRPAVTDTVQEPLGLSVGLGVKPAASNTLFAQGNPQDTGNLLDVCIIGQGFFQVEAPGYDDPVFTRNGAFKIDAEGTLVTSDGYPVVGADVFPEDAYDATIGKAGIVTYKIPGDDEIQEAGQIILAKFINPAGLEKIGGSLYVATPNSGDPTEWDPEGDNSLSLEAGYLEMSNVQVVEEMVSLITAQRAYEINSKVIQSSDEMLQTAANLRR
jgi:flagellar basal-body rod protein FlgG